MDKEQILRQVMPYSDTFAQKNRDKVYEVMEEYANRRVLEVLQEIMDIAYKESAWETYATTKRKIEG